MKKALSIILCLIVIVGLFTSCKNVLNADGTLIPSVFIRSEKNDSYEYDVYEDYTIITAYIGEDFRVSIPSRLGGKPVCGLGENSIGSSMLAIEVVDIPSSLVYIHPSAFYGKTTIEAFSVSGSNDAFKSDKGIIYSKDGTKLLHYPPARAVDTVTVSGGIKELGDYAFANCEKLQKAVLPGGLTSIGAHAFDGCDILYNVQLPEGITTIGDYAFYECKSLSTFKLPSTLLKIGANAFNYCISVKNITMPDSVKEIGDSAFFYCKSLTNVTLPKSLEKYGYKVFTMCNLLKELNITSQNKMYKSVDGVLYSADGTTLVDYPDGKTNKDIVISEGVKSIRAYAFYKEYNGDNSKKDDIIQSVDLNGVTSIGENAFSNRHLIPKIDLPDSVTSFSPTAFYNCMGIKAFNTSANNSAYVSVDGVLYSKDKKTLVAYPIAKENTSFVIPEGTEHIGAYAISNNVTLLSIQVPSTIITVGDYAFYNSSMFGNEIKFSKALKSLGKYSFSHCLSCEGVIFEDNTITEIPEGCFECYDGVYGVVIPNGVTKIGKDAYRESSYIVYIELPPTVKEIGDRAFYDIDDLHDLRITSNVTTIGEEIVNIFAETNPDKLTLHVDSGSVAEEYAKNNKIPYKVNEESK